MAMVRLEIHASSRVADAVVRAAAEHPYAINVVRNRDVLVDRPGDVVVCDVPREAASSLLDQLQAIPADSGDCTISVSSGAAHVSALATDMQHAARGSGADALLWPVVEDTLDEEVDLSLVYLTFMLLSTSLATIGIVTNSAILLVGAMVLGPEFGPIASFCVSVIGRRTGHAMRALAALAVGFAVAVPVSFGITVLLRVTGVFPDDLPHAGLVAEVASPNVLTVVIALIAGVAGMLSLTSARSASLMGVLISVTTIPAAADAAALIAYGKYERASHALMTLGLNVAGVVAAGLATLALQRWLLPKLHALPGENVAAR